MCPKFRTYPVLKHTKCHISTNMSHFLKLCLLYCPKFFALAPTNRWFAERNRLSGNTAMGTKFCQVKKLRKWQQNYFTQSSRIFITNCMFYVGQAVMCSSMEQKVWGSNFKPVESNAMLWTACHHCDSFLKRSCDACRHNDTNIGPVTHYMLRCNIASVYERFWLDFTYA